MNRTGTAFGPNSSRRGGAALFALVFILLVAGALALYWFWLLPGQQNPDNKGKGTESEPVGQQPTNNARRNANQNTAQNTGGNANRGNEAGNANNDPDNDPPPANNDPEPEPEPQFDDDEVRGQVDRAEAAAGRKDWGDVKRELRGVRDRNLSEEMANRVAGLLSRAEIMDDFDGIDSIRQSGLEKDDPIPVKLFLGGGESGQVVGSMYRGDLEKLWRASESGPLPPKFKAFDTSVAARDEDADDFLVARNIGGYEAVSPRYVYKVKPWDTDEMDDYYQDRVDRIREVFETSNKTPVDKYLLARGLKRYAPAEDGHEWLREAKDLIDDALRDDPYLAQSVDCERSRDYQQYLQAVQQDDDMAGRMLDGLLDKYPQAAQLAEARIARAEGANAAKAMAGAVRRESERGASNGDQTKIEASGDLKAAMKGSGNEKLSAARKYLAEAKELDARAMPGKAGFQENLHKAVYHYMAARDLLNAAKNDGADAATCSKLLQEVFQGIFWCKKRMPL